MSTADHSKHEAPGTTRTTASLIAIVLLAGCGREPAGPAHTAPLASQAGSAVHRDLAALRRATAAFHDFGAAARAGWSAQITGCMSAGAQGAMGFHYGNVGLIDGVAEVERPELLLYEMTRDGGMRLVGVEYIIPYTFHPRDAAPPVLFGQEFARVDAFGLWGLHAWVWSENPSGMFAPWNPRVSCEFAATTAAMAHH